MTRHCSGECTTVPWVELERWRAALKTSCSMEPLEFVKLRKSMALSRCPPGNDDVARTHGVQVGAGDPHLVGVADGQSSENAASSTLGVITWQEKKEDQPSALRPPIKERSSG